MISSVSNATVRKISRLRKARGRRREGGFLVEGRRAVGAALDAEAPLRTVLHLERARAGAAPLLKEAERRGIPVHAVHERVMAHLTSAATAPDLLAVAVLREAAFDAARFDGGALLAGVHDPAAAGGILAAVAATGGTAAAGAEETVDLYDAKTVRAAHGAHFRIAVTPRVGGAAAAAALRTAGVRLIGLAEEGSPPWALDLRAPFALVIGPETAPGPADALCDDKVAYPSGGIVPGAAARTAAVLGEAVRQRRGE